MWKISHVAPAGNVLSYTSYNLAGSPLNASAPAQIECPRFTERHAWAKDWNNEAEAVARYRPPAGGVPAVEGASAVESMLTAAGDRGPRRQGIV